jgi:pyridoxine kinase
MKILSLSSAVAYGHVGNSAAVFPLQRLGFEVWPVDTVQFSNHPGHGAFGGEVTDPATVAQVVAGLDRLGVLAECDGLLTGYLGDPGSGEAALAARVRMPAGAVYLCDPVMGDDGPGVYVRPGIPEFLRDRALPAADAVTPNRFELELLAGMPVGDLAQAVAAARALLARGPKVVAATSLGSEGTTCLAVTTDGAWVVETPHLHFPQPVNGAGDLLAALLLGRLLRGDAAPAALAAAVSAVFAVLECTRDTGGRELALVAAQDLLAAPPKGFVPTPLPS